MVNLASMIETHDADRVGLISNGQATTYGELRASAGAVRRRLEADGLGPDARVFIACGNEPEFAIAVLGVLALGGVAIPLNPRSPLPEFLARVALAEPVAVLVGPSMRQLLDAAEAIPVPLIDMRTIDSDGIAALPVAPRSDDDLAFLMLTSGVTGDPKAAMLSHGNLAWVQKLTCDGSPDSLTADDVTLAVLPFAHIFGLNIVLLSSLRAGGVCVLEQTFDVHESLDLIRQHGVTRIAAVPPMWKRWSEADTPDDSFASVAYASSGAAALPAEVFAAIHDRFGLEIAEGYGLTETSSIISNTRGIPVRPTSVGQVVKGLELVLVDPDGTPVDLGDTGEIVVRGPGIFKGYLDAPEVTETVLTPDGWFWTGDIGAFDDDGYLYLVDRVKDLIIVSGFNVYPAEVEAVLIEHPHVQGVVVVGEPHPDRGEAVVAYVTGQVTEDELNTFARARLSGYKCPIEYHFVDALPIADSGKAVRKELRR